MELFDEYERLRNRSEAELMETLSTLTREQQDSGEMTNTRMEEIYGMLAPMLTEKQRRKMQEVIERLKR